MHCISMKYISECYWCQWMALLLYFVLENWWKSYKWKMEYICIVYIAYSMSFGIFAKFFQQFEPIYKSKERLFVWVCYSDFFPSINVQSVWISVLHIDSQLVQIECAKRVKDLEILKGLKCKAIANGFHTSFLLSYRLQCRRSFAVFETEPNNISLSYLLLNHRLNAIYQSIHSLLNCSILYTHRT